MAFIQPHGAPAADPGRAAMEYAASRTALVLHEDIFDHAHFDPEAAAAIDRYIESQERLELKTVGIDIGSSTSHLLFAKIILEREAQDLSSRYVIVRRDIVWRSPIMLTPFTAAGAIDAEALGAFIERCYKDAGTTPDAIDSGAVILTGEAIKKSNAEAIDELFAEHAGKFVCATAGHQLEAMLTAHGSGAVRYSQDPDTCVLHVDIGGGTTKFALIDKGVILGEAAVAVGGRLLATDASGVWARVDDSARLVGEALGIATDPRSLADETARQRIAACLAAIVADCILDVPNPLAAVLALTEPLRRPVAPAALTFSGGVSEYIFGHEQDHGDIARLLAAELCGELSRRTQLPLIDPGGRIRATVIGASQFTVQVSGKTIYLPDPDVLPVHNVPVVHLGLDFSGDIDAAAIAAAVRGGMARLDLGRDAPMAIAFAWRGDPEHGRLTTAAAGIVEALGAARNRDALLVLMIDGDVGKTFGHLLAHELGFAGRVLSVDGVQLQELDYVDVGALISPPGVVPVVIKSLLFSS